MLLLLFLPFEIQGKQVSPVAEEKTTPFRKPHLRCTLIKAPTNSSIQILFVLFLKDVEDLKHVCDTFEARVRLISSLGVAATISSRLVNGHAAPPTKRKRQLSQNNVCCVGTTTYAMGSDQ